MKITKNNLPLLWDWDQPSSKSDSVPCRRGYFNFLFIFIRQLLSYRGKNLFPVDKSCTVYTHDHQICNHTGEKHHDQGFWRNWTFHISRDIQESACIFSILCNYIDSLRLIVSLNAPTLPASKCNLQRQDSEQSLNNIYSVCSQCFIVAFGGKQRNRMYDFCSQSS